MVSRIPFNHKDLNVQQGYCLNGKKIQWIELMHLTLKGRDKIDHIEGSPPTVTNNKFTM